MGRLREEAADGAQRDRFELLGLSEGRVRVFESNALGRRTGRRDADERPERRDDRRRDERRDGRDGRDDREYVVPHSRRHRRDDRADRPTDRGDRGERDRRGDRRRSNNNYRNGKVISSVANLDVKRKRPTHS